MKDIKHKNEIIDSIQKFQLSESLIQALDDATQAKQVIEAVNCLKSINRQWH